MAVVRPDSDGDDKSILLTPYEVALVSELQVEAMRRCENLKRPFSFPTLIIAPRSSGGLATEAFEASELTVQMAAERVLELAGDQPTEADARVRTRDVFFPRPRFLRPFCNVVVWRDQLGAASFRVARARTQVTQFRPRSGRTRARVLGAHEGPCASDAMRVQTTSYDTIL